MKLYLPCLIFSDLTIFFYNLRVNWKGHKAVRESVCACVCGVCEVKAFGSVYPAGRFVVILHTWIPSMLFVARFMCAACVIYFSPLLDQGRFCFMWWHCRRHDTGSYILELGQLDKWIGRKGCVHMAAVLSMELWDGVYCASRSIVNFFGSFSFLERKDFIWCYCQCPG